MSETGQREVTRYASPVLKIAGSRWAVRAEPWHEHVGFVDPNLPTGWTAWTPSALYAGLWPTKQAAAEVLVKQAGYELERS